MSVQAICHIGICVQDLERSRAFYRDVLGFKELTRLEVDDDTSKKFLELDDLKLRCIFLERDGLRIELMFYGDSTIGDGAISPIYQRGLTHFAIRVDSVDELAARIEAAGGEILRQTEIHNDAYQSHAVFAKDPDGVRLELIEAPGDPMKPLGEPL
jgi:lactoylglutathione lyase